MATKRRRTSAQQTEETNNDSSETTAEIPRIKTKNAGKILTISSPATATQGEEIQIDIVICCESPPLTDCEDIQLRINGKKSNPISLSRGECKTFSKNITMPPNNLNLLIESLQVDEKGRTHVTDAKSTVIELVKTESEKTFINTASLATSAASVPLNLALLTGGLASIMLINNSESETSDSSTTAKIKPDLEEQSLNQEGVFRNV